MSHLGILTPAPIQVTRLSSLTQFPTLTLNAGNGKSFQWIANIYNAQSLTIRPSAGTRQPGSPLMYDWFSATTALKHDVTVVTF